MKKGILLIAILTLAACSADLFAPRGGGRGGRGGGRGGMRGWGRGRHYRPGWGRGWYGPRFRVGVGYPAVYTYPRRTYVAPALSYWTVKNDSGALVEFATRSANIILRPGEIKSLVNTGDFSINGQRYSTDDANISIAPDGTPRTY